MKKTLFSILLIGICMTGIANAKEKNPILLKQVYKKEELITLDKQNVAGGNGTLHGKFAFQSHGLRNEKDEPLVFLDIIAQNHALKAEK